jgi:uncharacterized protein
MKSNIKTQSGFSEILLVITAFVVVISLTSVVLWKNSNSIKQTTDPNPTTYNLLPTTNIPSPTPFPFSEMTIPHIRNKQFESGLERLEKVSENTNYTSYTTSYISEGLKVNGLLTVPKTGGYKYPAIVFIHGYIPPASYRTTQNYATYVDYLARNGFAVFKIDLRGHDRSEGEPGGAYFSADYIEDTLNAYSALQKTDFVDPERIGLWGHSMGGNVVFRSFVAKNIPAAAIWAGAVYTYEDMQEFSIQDGSYRPPDPNSERARKRQLLRDTHGDFNKDNNFWRQVVPTNYLEGVNGALQLHHAVDDNVVSIRYSQNLANLLKNTSIKHELIEYPTGGHNLTGNTFTQAMQNTVEFFRENL